MDQSGVRQELAAGVAAALPAVLSARSRGATRPRKLSLADASAWGGVVGVNAHGEAAIAHPNGEVRSCLCAARMMRMSCCSAALRIMARPCAGAHGQRGGGVWVALKVANQRSALCHKTIIF